ncbi:transposase-like protein [Bibersteinia trehalosi USDA-ARS-USMARC-188]|uniref:Transposase-like protein n=2 Tax=Bibersteinia trehalosi TaxID=47735 RepID=A0A4V7I839_BIBTR|nr:transposase-like protein [Bibersteinia trehalosi USDA-ARS-USMARC-192]AHG81187.1 transposase-like protein [Bibersteinia trehalosi USDA-ARS-USMARC-188]AHG83400.1 transposase-like protein [Bibersteinia trehalosi USDA-ARS-USMARC-189]
MKPKYPKMLPQKTEEERLRYRILELKTKCYFTERFETFEQLEQTILDDIHYYNHKRIQVKLKGLSPVEYRTQSLN